MKKYHEELDSYIHFRVNSDKKYKASKNIGRKMSDKLRQIIDKWAKL